ncbi:MAG: extracellular solute-binding protein, partial [Lachnospiraceae bacterium]|nr:extracellular solute-binding protein [Lachnospiraceae bacterium]
SKINVIALSGEELPDIIFDPGDSLQTLMDEELLLDLSEYYDNPDYAVNINDASERIGMDIKTYQTQANGAVYGIPSFSQNPGADVYQKLWVYQPWLDALGVELPETTDEFYEVCKLISQTDLNGNGKNDELGLTGTDIGGWFDCLMTPFVFAHDSQFRTMTDGQVGFAYTTEEWKEGLKYIKKFFDEGLIPKETLTQDKDQYNSFVFSEEPVLFAFCGWCYEGSDIVRRSELSGIPALEGPNGVKNACYIPSIPSGTGAVITVDCENPEAAFLVCDYLCSEDMSNINRYGKLGVNWDYWENAKETIENPEEYGSAYGYEMFMITYYQDGVDFWYDPNPQNVCYFQNGPYVRDSLANLGYVMKTANLSEEETLRLFNETKDIAVQNDCYNYLPDEVFDYGPLTTEETSQTADIKTNLNNYVKEATSAFLTGSMDIDADWDAYLKELENIGYKTMLETYQTAYDRVH